MAVQGIVAGGASSRRRLRAARALLYGLVLTLTASACYTSVLILRRQEALNQVSRHNVSWTISQAATEVARLQAALGSYALRPGPTEREALQLRMDLLASRLTLLEDGEVGTFTRGHPEREAAVAAFRSAIAMAEALIPRLQEPGVMQRLSTVLGTLLVGRATHDTGLGLPAEAR